MMLELGTADNDEDVKKENEINLEANTPECIQLLITHDTCMCVPLVGHTCTDRLLSTVTVHYDSYPVHIYI